MKIDGVHYRSIWRDAGGEVRIIDQRWLPHELRIVALRTLQDFARAISEMWVRGAPLIGATAAWGVALRMQEDPSDQALADARARLLATRPTAINLRWALDRMHAALAPLPAARRAEAAAAEAAAICDEDVEINRRIGEHGLALLREASARKGGGRVNVLTHCNAGWIATVDWGTATSPIYQAVEAGMDVHVFVDETRPRNQGAQLTAWELASHGVSHELVVDNAGGHLMQRGEVDLVIVGTDRVTARGDVCNKIGTYLKALAARANGVPFHVALPSPTIDWTATDGLSEIPIEERDPREVTHVQGLDPEGRIVQVRICPEATGARNPAFDVTPAELVSGLITERGLCAATPEAMRALFPDLAGG
ncbi:S-methyl-5-thioribose-1-phosphate isomerase [Oceanicella actignis]|uniref:Methylthioribose-1-phosphate isomerase n=1 Tax=Oceanicella actignis TaxID=1189325 RepID=A0A1M7SID6_9RHOB|nr:S-methyl-5-thioribose-1-phosphate isomerase [Oceanicella actignis]SET17885.1 methylthioribose-1-phosphate isomerase [Oceanicella actignis]SHN58219.1 methylthioribose-1-phosphate isomerase [Oceanicella actignis]